MLVAIIRHTGISVVARPARYRPRVAASAASVTFSGRTARASGSRRIRAIRSLRPDDEAGLGTSDQLVAAECHEVGSGRQRSAGVGS